MKPRPGPTTPMPTYNPYKELPTTDEYMLARDCLNVNTTGFYEVYIPIDWIDFNLSLSFTGKNEREYYIVEMFAQNIFKSLIFFNGFCSQNNWICNCWFPLFHGTQDDIKSKTIAIVISI